MSTPRELSAGRRREMVAVGIARMAAGTALVIWGATNLFKALFQTASLSPSTIGWGNLGIGVATVLILSLVPLLLGIHLLRKA